jgi:hypothetical protein
MKKKGIILGGICILLFAGCKTDEDFSGPSLNDLYGKFTILQPLTLSDNSVDFSAGESTVFGASFSKNVDWKLQVKGLQSGAIKEISGFSNMLDQNNARWIGTTTILPMFKLEECVVELTFLNEVDTLRDTLNIIGTRPSQGLVLSDFENGTNSGWNSFVQLGTDMSFAVETSNLAAQGDKFFNVGGIVDWDWLIGLINLPASAYGNPTFDLSSNPDNEFFNVMIYKPELLSNGIMLFQFREDDNGDGVYTENSEDMFSIEIHMSVNGWNLYSVKYSDLATLVNGQPANAFGNGIHEPNKLKQVSVLFLANPASGYSNAYLDYMTFTQGGPLEP